MELVGHQGDVVFFKVNKLPNLKLLKQDAQTKAGVFQRGALSGHDHALVDPKVAVLFRGDDGLIYVDAPEGAQVMHGRARDFLGEEPDTDYHKPVTLEPGIYAAGMVEETDWLTKTIRKVIDG